MRKAPELKKLGFLGVEIGGWGSLISLILSIVAVAYSTADRWLALPQPIMLPPSQIDLQCYPNTVDKVASCDNSSYMIADSNVTSFINGRWGLSAFTVVDASVTMTFLDKSEAPIRSINLDWYYFGTGTESISLLTVPINQAVSREIRYFPFPSFDSTAANERENFLDIREFERIVLSPNFSEIEFKFSFAVLQRSGEYSARCRMKLSQQHLSDAKRGKAWHYSGQCAPLG